MPPSGLKGQDSEQGCMHVTEVSDIRWVGSSLLRLVRDSCGGWPQGEAARQVTLAHAPPKTGLGSFRKHKVRTSELAFHLPDIKLPGYFGDFFFSV